MARPQDPSHLKELSLRERMPDYLAMFAVGIGVSVTVGLIVTWVSSHSFVAGFGYSMIGLGVVLLLAGGVSGGGYGNLGVGALATMLGSEVRAQPTDTADEDPAELRRQVFGRRGDARERLRKGLRPEANPRAFWQVIAGFAYFGLGTYIVIALAS